MTQPETDRWYPVAASDDLVPRHAFHGRLRGRELVAWRADDGHANVWDNRCLHRGVRLSIGRNDGRELVCRYHGWRYANRTGGCTYIPAHPAGSPARTICTRTFPVVERYGLVWTGETPVGDPPAVALLDATGAFPLRALPVDAPAPLVEERLAELAPPDWDPTPISWFVQPVDAAHCVIRPVRAGAPDDEARLAVLRRHNARLTALRASIEAEAAALPPPPPMDEVIESNPLLVDIDAPPPGRSAPLRVTVARRWSTAADVVALELHPVAGTLPTCQPGAHLDVHLPNGLVRQYSLTNGPGEQAWYRIGVKREPGSRGGSAAIHDEVREGDVLAVSEPRNGFPLRRDADRTVLIAGGIGITPLLAMAQTLHHDGLRYELHCFARSEEHVAFRDVLATLAPHVTMHLGLDPEATTDALDALLATRDDALTTRIYVCGPAPMIEATRRLASDHGWPAGSVHAEFFANPTEIDHSTAFEVALARSALTLAVPAGRTILEVLRDAGVAVPSSCEQGACGTCDVTVIEGTPLHQDVHLGDREREAGDRIMVCVSRAPAGSRLVLDI